MLKHFMERGSAGATVWSSAACTTRQHQALHLLDDPLPNFVSGLTEEECQDSTAFGKRIAQEVDRYV